jgi:isochorismate synthase
LQKENSKFFNDIKEHLEAKLPFVIYRKPEKAIVQAALQNDAQLHYLDDFNRVGFVFAPFNKREKILIFPESQSRRFECGLQNEKEFSPDKIKSELVQLSNLAEIKEGHINLIEESLALIESGKAKKIVLSWKEVLKVENFKLLNTFKKMLLRYENAFVYLWFHPKVGMWMGASPERLLHIKNNLLESMALAGTQLFKGSREVVWSSKEIQEQKFVTDFLLEQLKGSVASIKVSKPYTAKAGNLLHIRTDISGILSPDKGLKNLVDSLHPTPAVCGLPKDIATNFILDKEGYHRDFYSGYLGELNIDQSTNFYVNLRCMNIKGNEVSVYVGGGITIDSIPQDEWEETLSKTHIIKNIL